MESVSQGIRTTVANRAGDGGTFSGSFGLTRLPTIEDCSEFWHSVSADSVSTATGQRCDSRSERAGTDSHVAGRRRRRCYNSMSVRPWRRNWRCSPIPERVSRPLAANLQSIGAYLVPPPDTGARASPVDGFLATVLETAGSSMVKQAPRGGALRTRIWPPCSEIIP